MGALQLNGEVSRWDELPAGNNGAYSDGKLAVCLPLKTELIRAFSTCISWRCMQDGIYFGWALALRAFLHFFCVVLAAVVLGDWQIHQDQSRYLVK